MRSFLVLAVLTGTAIAKPAWRPPPPPSLDANELAARLAEAIRNRNVSAVQALLRDPLQHDGLWFPDAACAKQFGKRGALEKTKVRALAKCLAQTKLIASTRRSGDGNGAILTFEPGVELEVVFRGGRVSWIAGIAPGDADRGQPALTVQAFETLRTAGTTQLDGAIGKKLSAPSSAWIKICLDTTGKVASTFVAGATPSLAGDIFIAMIGDWKFRPFTHRRIATPACSHSFLSFPASSAPAVEVLPPPDVTRVVGDYDTDEDLEITLKTFDFTGVSVGGGPPPPPPPPPPPAPRPQNVPVTVLEANRIAGNPQIDPDPATKTAITNSKTSRVVGSYKMCLDDTGAVTTVTQLKSTGFADYDRKIIREVRAWAYTPYVVNGVGVPVCTAVTFVYR